jgi:predicted GIY-YIG superfamily endonuclease
MPKRKLAKEESEEESSGEYETDNDEESSETEDSEEEEEKVERKTRKVKKETKKISKKETKRTQSKKEEKKTADVVVVNFNVARKEPIHLLFKPEEKLAPINCIYILKLLKPGVDCWYVGWTALFPRRIRQHNSFLKVKQMFTTKRSSKGLYKWHPVCILSGKSFTKTECLRIEAKVKNKRGCCPLRLGDGTLAKNGWKKKNGKAVKPQVKRMLIVANAVDKWTSKCDRSAINIPLTLTWYMKDEMPLSSLAYLPPYVDEVVLDNYQLPTK